MKMMFVAVIFISFTVFGCSQTQTIEKPPGDDYKPITADYSNTQEIPAEDNTSTSTDVNNSSSLPDDTKFVQNTPPDYIKPIEIGEVSIYGYYIPTNKFSENKLPYALVLSNLDYNKIAWGFYKVLPDDKHEKIGVGFMTVDKKAGGIFIEQRKISNNEDSEFIGLELYPAEFKNNELFIKKAVQSEGKTIFNDLLEKYEQLHFIRIADLEVKPTAVVFGNFHPADSNGLPDKNVLLRMWTNGVWTLSATHEYFKSKTKAKLAKLEDSVSKDEKGSDVVVTGTWSAQENKIIFVRNIKSMFDDPEIDIENNPPTEEYEFVFDTKNFVLWLTATQFSENTKVGITPKSKLKEVTVFLPAN